MSWCSQLIRRSFSTSQALFKVQAGKYRVTKNKDRPLTYEMANQPYQIAVRKSWLSWNTSGLRDGLRASETAVEDIFIRKFMSGTWHRLFVTEVIIKRRHNAIWIGGIVERSILPRKLYFLIGYTEELLSYVLKCPIKLEIQTTPSRSDVIYKYI